MVLLVLYNLKLDITINIGIVVQGHVHTKLSLISLVHSLFSLTASKASTKYKQCNILFKFM